MDQVYREGRTASVYISRCPLLRLTWVLAFLLLWIVPPSLLHLTRILSIICLRTLS
jgi:hypothetical protein